MGVNYSIPFYANTADDTHCVQASFKMIAEFFRPELKFDFEHWDRISHKKVGGWTWPMSSLIWFKEMNFDVVNIEDFSYARFAKEGKAYLQQLYGQEIADIQESKTDLASEQQIAKHFISMIPTIERAPTISEAQDFLQKRYLLAVNLNIKMLNGEEGYAGHLVVVKGFDDDGFIVNDPGAPAAQNRRVDYQSFLKAWAYPDERALNLTAIGLKHVTS